MKPLKNSKHVMEVKDITEKGFGIGYINDFVIFIDGALPGDVTDTHILKVKKNYGYGKIIEIKTPSPFRIKSPCPVSNNCGGCQWQNCEYKAQLKFKKEIVKSALEKIGGLQNPPVFDTIGMNNPGRYRNKAVFPIVKSNNKAGFTIGMYAPRSHRIIEVSDCGIQHEAHTGILAAVKNHMFRHKITAYDEATHKGLMRFIMVRTSLFSGEVMIITVINGREIPFFDDLKDKLTKLGASSILINRNISKGNTILSDEFQLLHGEGYIREKIGEIEYRISAPSFFQVNPVQTKILYDTAIMQAELDGTQTVIDAHAGVGGVALFAAKHAKKVIGVDIVPSAINDAKKNAALNGIFNTEFICGAAEEIIPKLIEQESIRPDLVFLDPPRKGCEPALLNALIAAEIKKIIYISCNPATLARDIKHLTANGFLLTAAQPIDMFPFTGKVETCVSLRWKDFVRVN